MMPSTSSTSVSKAASSLSSWRKSKHTDVCCGSIGAIELLDVDDEGAVLLAASSDAELLLYNVRTRTKHTLLTLPPRPTRPPPPPPSPPTQTTAAATTETSDDEDEQEQDEFGALRVTSFCDTTADGSAATRCPRVLFAASAHRLHMFDVATTRTLGAYTFAGDSLGCIELNAAQNLVACADDSGSVQLFDLRTDDLRRAASNNSSNSTDSVSVGALSLRKSLSRHENICSTVRFSACSDVELFSGSFDCSVIKWDLRFVAKLSQRQRRRQQKPFQCQANIGELLATAAAAAATAATATSTEVGRQATTDGDFHSSMTPCFVHSMQPWRSAQGRHALLCGVESGQCVLLEARAGATLDYLAHAQLQPYNCALTQLAPLLDSAAAQNEQQPRLVAAGGNGRQVEFAYLHDEDATIGAASAVRVRTVRPLRIDHTAKINCLKYYATRGAGQQLFVADTSRNLTVYELEERAGERLAASFNALDLSTSTSATNRKAT